MQNEMSILVKRQPGLRHWLAALFMVACFVAAWWMTPHKTWFEHLGRPEFSNVIPTQFGDWVESGGAAGALVVDPQQEDALHNLYTQIVSRTYLHKPSGRRIMLSIAYGDIQTYSKQLHRPESCYSSQGYKIKNLHEEEELIQAAGQSINVYRMTASADGRLEQVTYWIRIGDKVIRGSRGNLNIARMLMGLKGYISDGLLFRVSEITEDAQTSNQLHDMFINDLLRALSPTQQAMLIGESFQR
jgi:EpsI family protein